MSLYIICLSLPLFLQSHIQSFVEFSGSWKCHETVDFCSQTVANFHPQPPPLTHGLNYSLQTHSNSIMPPLFPIYSSNAHMHPLHIVPQRKWYDMISELPIKKCNWAISSKIKVSVLFLFFFLIDYSLGHGWSRLSIQGWWEKGLDSTRDKHLKS